MHNKLDCADIEAGGDDDILAYSNKNTSLVDDNLFGTEMSIAPIFIPFLDYQKMRVTTHTQKTYYWVKCKSYHSRWYTISKWADSKM